MLAVAPITALTHGWFGVALAYASVQAPMLAGMLRSPPNAIVFDGAPEQLTDAVLRDIYGDHRGGGVNERITSTNLAATAMPAMART